MEAPNTIADVIRLAHRHGVPVVRGTNESYHALIDLIMDAGVHYLRAEGLAGVAIFG